MDGGFRPKLLVGLSGHLGYEKGDPEAALHPDSRNGSSAKTVATSVGDVELAIPRDRDGSFTPTLVPKGSRRVGGLDDMIISLYAGGMTVRDIEHHLVSTIGTEISRETISKITDEVLDEVLAWQQRPVEAFYPVIYLDAIIVKVRDGAHVRNKAAHIAVGVDMDGIKHVLGIWMQATEGAKFWAAFATNTTRGQLPDLELRHRGRARCEDRIRVAKDTGLNNLPLASFAANRIWCAVVALAAEITAWMQMLAFTDTETNAARRWEPKKLRYRIFTIPATLARTGRRVWLHLSTRSPWAALTLTGLQRLADLAPG